MWLLNTFKLDGVRYYQLSQNGSPVAPQTKELHIAIEQCRDRARVSLAYAEDAFGPYKLINGLHWYSVPTFDGDKGDYITPVEFYTS